MTYWFLKKEARAIKREVDKVIVDFLLENGGNRWRRYDNDRIYFDSDLVIETVYKDGFVVPKNIRQELRSKRKIYYDLKDGKLYGMKGVAAAFREAVHNKVNPPSELVNGILEDYIDD